MPPAAPAASTPAPAMTVANVPAPADIARKPVEPPKKAEPVKAAPEPAKAAEPAKKAEPAAKPSGNTLKVVFKGQSWVEVRDGKGRLLLSRLNAPGTDAEVSGNPPFNVIVGNAPEVQLFYNDHEFDLEPHTKVAVARFTVAVAA